MEFIETIAFFVLAAPLLLFIIFKPAIQDARVRNNVSNSDPFTRHYCYILHSTQDETVNKLSIHNITDTLEYTFDADCLTITFSHQGASIKHQLSFYTVENETYLKVSRIKFMHSKSNIPLMINQFFVKKLDAKPVDYNYFEATVCSH